VPGHHHSRVKLDLEWHVVNNPLYFAVALVNGLEVLPVLSLLLAGRAYCGERMDIAHDGLGCIVQILVLEVLVLGGVGMETVSFEVHFGFVGCG